MLTCSTLVRISFRTLFDLQSTVSETQRQFTYPSSKHSQRLGSIGEFWPFTIRRQSNSVPTPPNPKLPYEFWQAGICTSNRTSKIASQYNPTLTSPLTTSLSIRCLVVTLKVAQQCLTSLARPTITILHISILSISYKHTPAYTHRGTTFSTNGHPRRLGLTGVLEVSSGARVYRLA